MQRGRGTFDATIAVLQKLNGLGYGHEGSPLRLNLVYNPVGPHLPPHEETLEASYKQRLKEDFSIVFHRLYTITNMPITRYAQYLKAKGDYEAYVRLLIDSFNPATIDGLMCRHTLSVGWDGRLYDCDFNLAMGMSRTFHGKSSIADFSQDLFQGLEILTGEHCFGCTAGVGSSCQGAVKASESHAGGRV